MLISQNFAVLECTECHERIKIEPQRPFNSPIHECKKQAITTQAKVTPKPKKTPKNKTFLEKIGS